MTRYYIRILDRWGKLGRRWRIGLLSGFTVALLGASLAGYHQWHYMQHDNRFCLSCHLMADPFQRFSRSAHAKLECHTCHEGRLPEQLHQLWMTLVEHPTNIGLHADVPNGVCAKCHVTGDSTRWKIIAATAGHRVHLESKDPRLKGIRCVTCHGVSLHEFASVDRTCLKSGCHERNTIKLGTMGQLPEMHCTSCHNFLAEARTFAVDSLGKPLTPAAAQCLSCHAMQERTRKLDIGKDPHQGVCGDCHNPHTQTKPQDVNCTTGSCHAGWRSVSFHNGVPHPERCTSCHEPHSWRVNGQNCLRCHANVSREAPLRARRVTLAPRSLLRAAGAVADFASAGAVLWPDFQAPQGAPARQTPAGAAQVPRFSHGDHRGQQCSSCHSSRVKHGELLVHSLADCQSCHHSGPDRTVCATCHDVAALSRATLQTEQTFPVAAKHATETRRLPFEHAPHQGFACTQCHTNSVSRAPDGAACAGCHASHHTATANCVACHAATRPILAHKAADHPNCVTCHGARAANLPATREMCLMCHTTQTRHVPGKPCEQCHKVLAQS